MARMITVTEKNIEDSHIRCENSKEIEGCCPVALALQDAGFSDALVLETSLKPLGVKGIELRMSRRLQKFVECWDQNRYVNPIRFRLSNSPAYFAF